MTLTLEINFEIVVSQKLLTPFMLIKMKQIHWILGRLCDYVWDSDRVTSDVGVPSTHLVQIITYQYIFH